MARASVHIGRQRVFIVLKRAKQKFQFDEMCQSINDSFITNSYFGSRPTSSSGWNGCCVPRVKFIVVWNGCCVPRVKFIVVWNGCGMSSSENCLVGMVCGVSRVKIVWWCGMVCGVPRVKFIVVWNGLWRVSSENYLVVWNGLWRVPSENCLVVWNGLWRVPSENCLVVWNGLWRVPSENCLVVWNGLWRVPSENCLVWNGLWRVPRKIVCGMVCGVSRGENCLCGMVVWRVPSENCLVWNGLWRVPSENCLVWNGCGVSRVKIAWCCGMVCGVSRVKIVCGGVLWRVPSENCLWNGVCCGVSRVKIVWWCGSNYNFILRPIFGDIRGSMYLGYKGMILVSIDLKSRLIFGIQSRSFNFPDFLSSLWNFQRKWIRQLAWRIWRNDYTCRINFNPLNLCHNSSPLHLEVLLSS
ncbi:hypothetical protein HNY73_007255 [Argiope bruennichi]|uniref:Uncharacterized protein n=1 Tax=Argiope bruennichi TaxID=94029 RepID=A0A8T0FED3_ARGBR|nr:hypothetical protein HNY73_007255 [Argiope bruennichi]